MSIDNKIKSIGEAFRGLWCVNVLDEKGCVGRRMWYASFSYKGEVVETRPFTTPEVVLDYVLECIYGED